MIFRIEQQGVAGLGWEKGQRAYVRSAAIVFGGAALDVTDLISELEVFALEVPLARPGAPDSYIFIYILDDD